ncbi:unnamed protein product [Durusdinium trenchii]|uniref:EF-hand domain-containing protein n=1 Tax=Durusdinium trenchii TaxID=1381693 RepID=A0ABP0R4J8_9DINO
MGSADVSIVFADEESGHRSPFMSVDSDLFSEPFPFTVLAAAIRAVLALVKSGLVAPCRGFAHRAGQEGVSQPPPTPKYRPGETWASGSKAQDPSGDTNEDKLESLLAEYHGELMQKLMLQELMLKQMLPVLQYGHLSYGYEIDPEPPGPSKDSKTKDFSEGLGPLPDQKNSRLSLMKANTVPVSFKEDGEQLFSTFHAEDLNRVEMAASVDGQHSRQRYASRMSEARARAHQMSKTTGQMARRVVENPFFDAFFAVVVLLNSVFIGYEVEVSLTTTQRNTFMQVCQYSFTFLFAAELHFRIMAFGKDFFCNEDWNWALLDVFIVLSSFWEVIVDISKAMGESNIETIAGISSLKAFRIIRITRVLKTVQLVRILRFVVALRTLVTSIFHTLKSLVWAMVLLTLIVYVFAVLFTQAVNDFVKDNKHVMDPDQWQALELVSAEYFGSLGTTMLSLFMSIAGGVSWEEVLVPLHKMNTIWILIFLVYIAFTYFAVLNVVTAVFCQTAIDSAQNDHTTMMHAILANKEAHLQKVKDLFNRLGAEKSGEITYLMFEEKINAPEVREYFSSLGLDVWDAWSFFKMLDLDESGAVDMEEFLMGCLRVRGSAKAIDISKCLALEIQDHSIQLLSTRRCKFSMMAEAVGTQ